MPKKNPQRLVSPPSSDSEISEDDNDGSGSSVVTSFESLKGFKSRAAYEKKKKEEQAKKPGASSLLPRRGRAPSTSQAIESPRRGTGRPSTSKAIESPRKGKGGHSTSKAIESPRRGKGRPSTAQAIESPRRGTGQPSASKAIENLQAKSRKKVLSKQHNRGPDRQERDSRIRHLKEDSDDDAESPRRQAKNDLEEERRPGSDTHRRKTVPPVKRRDLVLSEIRKLQRSTRLLLRKMPFCRLVREIGEGRKRELRWQVLALQALQEAAEIYLVNLFEDSVLCTLHRSRVTLTLKDMQLARKLRSRFENFY